MQELPYRLHEYAWWNLIDIGEMYVVLQVDRFPESSTKGLCGILWI
jgi:hypothetical protein